MTLTPEEKAARARQRMIEKARDGTDTIGSYAGKVAVVFQAMIRANAGALPDGMIHVVVEGEMTRVYRRVGQCACITCGKVLPWKNSGATHGSLDTGHFLASRRNSILFEEDGVAPQCVFCNCHKGGAPKEYRLWMLEVRGENVVLRLEQLKNTVRKFTFEELVGMKIEYTARLNAAIKRMEGDA